MSSEVKRYVKADVMREEGSPDVLPHLPRFVLASDFDRVAADLRRAREALEQHAIQIVEWSNGVYCYQCLGCDQCKPEWSYRSMVVHLEDCPVDAVLSGKETP